ncbi:unnamed protein product [Dibothriocephalus latus]|uniref:BZIP domain-containing protein n=1 Tax=Dibothriocephalus latus TaxID=60516 RepID=A0A3P7KYB3_DIBLA|nr:unnamed protein product [Dibothriocephalus latus]
MSLAKSLYHQPTPQYWGSGCTPDTCDQLELSSCTSLPSVSSTPSCRDVDFWSSEPPPECVESDRDWLLQLTQEQNNYTTNYECSIPAEIVDFVTSYDKCGHDPADLSEFNWLSFIPSQSSHTRGKKTSSQPSSTALDSKCSTLEVPGKASVKLKKRQSNRDAAFRYRQKMKEKYSSIYNDLKASMLAYNKAKLEYERARDAFDALKKVILDLTPPVQP